MMEYTSKYWNMLTPLIKKSLLKRYGKEETAELLRKTNQIYRDMLRYRKGQPDGVESL